MMAPKRTTLRRGCTVSTAILVIGLAGSAIAHSAPPGPTLSYQQWPGGVTVNITDKSGTTSWCTYSAETYKSPPLLLAADATYPLVIPFSAPDNRVWNVVVNCDNGANTYTTYNYIPGQQSTEPPLVISPGLTPPPPAPPCPSGLYRRDDGQCDIFIG
jgi:hypothetical protein